MGSGDKIMFNLALDLARPSDSRAYPAKFSGHGHCASGDIMVLVCHLISELVTCNFMDRSLMASHRLSKFGGYKHCGSGDINIPANTVILTQMQDVASMTVYARSFPALVLCLKHKSCHSLTHEVSG